MKRWNLVVLMFSVLWFGGCDGDKTATPTLKDGPQPTMMDPAKAKAVMPGKIGELKPIMP